MGWYQKLSLTAQTMCRVLAGLFVILLVAGLVVILAVYPFESPFAFALGLFLGSALSLWKVVLLERSLLKSVDMGEGAKNHANLQMMLRYLLTAGVLAVAFFFRHIIGPFGVVAGILSLQITAYVTAFKLRGINLDRPKGETPPLEGAGEGEQDPL